MNRPLQELKITELQAINTLCSVYANTGDNGVLRLVKKAIDTLTNNVEWHSTSALRDVIQAEYRAKLRDVHATYNALPGVARGGEKGKELEGYIRTLHEETGY